MLDDLAEELMQGAAADYGPSEAEQFHAGDTGQTLTVRRIQPQQQMRRQPPPQQRFQQPQMRRFAPPPPMEYVDEEPQFADASGLPVHEPRTEAEARLHRARYFEVLLANPIFPHANSQGALVEQSLRAWAENELAALLGMRPPPDLAPFTKVQIVALRTLANKLVGNAMPSAPAPVAEPQQKAPAVQETKVLVVSASSPNAGPKVRRPLKKAAALPPSEPPPAPRRRPRSVGNALIPARPPPSRDVQQPQSVPQSRPPERAPVQRRQEAPVNPDSPVPEVDENSLNDGEILQRGSKTYKVVITNDDKGDRAVVYRDITPPPTVTAQPPVAMPEGLALEQTTMQIASNQVERAMKGSRVLQRATNAALNS